MNRGCTLKSQAERSSSEEVDTMRKVTKQARNTRREEEESQAEGPPGGPVAKATPASAGDTGLIPGPCSCHTHAAPACAPW